MSEWWSSLSTLAKFFALLAVFASVWQTLFLVGSFFGLGGDADHDSPDSADNNAADGAKILSLRALVAGAVGFGWSGLLALNSGVPVFTAMLVALLGGAIFLFVIYGLMRMFFSLREDGTLNYQNAVGLPARVYMTVPPLRSGKGQVEIHFQGRLVMATAVTDHDQPLSPQTAVTVSGVEGSTTLIVKLT